MLSNFITQTIPKFGNIGLFLGGTIFFIESIRDNNIKNELIACQQRIINQQKQLQELESKVENLQNTIPAVSEEDMSNFETGFTRLNNSLNNLNQNDSNVINAIKESKNIESLFRDYIDKFKGNKFLDGFNINDYFNNINQFLSSLNHEQLGAIVHISGSIAIFYCMLTIIFTVFGDKLIIKFNLESKYPKLAGLIRLRRKYLEYNMIFNILLIFLILGIII